MARQSFAVQVRFRSCAIVLCLFGLLVTPSWNQAAFCQEAGFDIAAELASRLKIRITPEDDSLLRSLEQDFLDLLKKSAHVHELLKAEELLVITDDRSRSSEYQKSIKILRRNRDAAAIPLLLRFMLIHEKVYYNSGISRDYRDAIAIIAGYDLDAKDMYSGNKYQRFRTYISDAVGNWWNPIKDNLRTDLREMSREQLKVVVDAVLEEVRRIHDLDNIGMQRYETTSEVQSRFYHGVLQRDARGPIPLMDIVLLMPILETVGYWTEGKQNEASSLGNFPFEAVIMLEQMGCQCERDQLRHISRDSKQTVRVRLICLLSLFKYEKTFSPDHLLALAAETQDIEEQLVATLALRYAGEGAQSSLLKLLEHSNPEIVNAAAISLQDANSTVVIEKFEELLTRDRISSPVWLLEALANNQSPQAEELLERLLRMALAGKELGPYHESYLNAYANTFNIPNDVYWIPERNLREKTELAIAYVANERDKAKRKINATPKNESPAPDADVTTNDDETLEVRYDKLRSENDAFRKELLKLTSTVNRQANRTGLAMSRQRELVIVRIGNECTRIEEMMGIASEPSPGQLAVAIDGAKNVRDMLQETYYFDRVSMNRLANSLNGFLRILERPQNKNYFAVANEFKVTIDEIIRDEMLTTE